MLEKIVSFLLAFLAGILVNLPINFNKYDLPPALSYYFRSIAPCRNPIYYKIGTIDPQYNIKREDVINDAEAAADIWNNTKGKILFVYDPKGPLTINLVYDERQSITSQINAKEAELQNAKSQLTPNETKYNNLVADFKKRVAALNTQIAYWNNQGGAPPDEYQKLVAEQNSLKQEATQINSLVAVLNISTKEYNSVVDQLNQSAANFNDVLQNKPEEGLYSPSKNEIDIYLALNHDELVHTLAHELGHALGLPHTLDKRSIMFSLTSKTTTVAKEDITALNDLCSPAKK